MGCSPSSQSTATKPCVEANGKEKKEQKVTSIQQINSKTVDNKSAPKPAGKRKS